VPAGISGRRGGGLVRPAAKLAARKHMASTEGTRRRPWTVLVAHDSAGSALTCSWTSTSAGGNLSGSP